MSTVDEQVARALLTEFSQEQIYHDDLPERNNYPAIMYTDISETPALHADNKLYARSHVIRVTIVTQGNAGISALKERVYRCMDMVGFIWQSTTKTHDKNEYYTSMDFEIGVEV